VGLATDIRRTTAFVSASMITAWSAPPTDATTRRPSGVIARPAGLAPTSIEALIVSLSVARTLTLPVSPLETNTFFRPV
jgi:hypothetical protein